MFAINKFNSSALLCFLLLLLLCDANEARRRDGVKKGKLIALNDDDDADAIADDKQMATNEAEFHRDYWYNEAQKYLNEKLQQQTTTTNDEAVQQQTAKKRARNIILFLGDGMSLATITATRKFMNDAAYRLSFERSAAHFGLTKTYCVNSQVPDSAATATAFLSGIKANYGTIGVNAKVTRSHCELTQQAALFTESIAKWAQDAGKWAGLVTTARVTHATPAGVYAHVANRRWENDNKIRRDNCSSEQILDIARQLIEWPVGRDLHVILGGGRSNFLSENIRDAEGHHGKRSDDRDLIQFWIDEKQQRNLSAEYIWQRKDLLNMNFEKVDYLLGLFSRSHMPYHSELEDKKLGERKPTLSEMTKAAIEILRRNEHGFFLFVESAKIDMAHHDTRARRSLEETAEFARAVEIALNMTEKDETLIVVTADHAHTMSISGYPHRNADILALNNEFAADELPYTILSYANGPGYAKTYGEKGRKDLSNKDFVDSKRRYMATVPLESETHGGDDTGVFAMGPYADIFSGNYEQSFLPLLMAKAAKIGPFGT